LNNSIATIKALLKYKHADHFTSFDKDKKTNANEENLVVENIVEAKKEVTKAPAKKVVEKKTPAKKPAAKTTKKVTK
jgi:hypothetical protein